jgi:hypothetical protein
VGLKGRFGFEENNEWDGNPDLDLKIIINWMESQIWL